MRTSSYLTGCVVCSKPTAHPDDRGIQLCEACARWDLILRGGLTGTVEQESKDRPQEGIDTVLFKDYT